MTVGYYQRLRAVLPVDSDDPQEAEYTIQILFRPMHRLILAVQADFW